MKANEAPDMIYVSNYSSGLTYNWHNERLAVNDIEYTRTDAFIEKLFKWLEENVERHISADGEYTVYYDEMFEDFKNTWKESKV